MWWEAVGGFFQCGQIVAQRRDRRYICFFAWSGTLTLEVLLEVLLVAVLLLLQFRISTDYFISCRTDEEVGPILGQCNWTSEYNKTLLEYVVDKELHSKEVKN